MKWPLGLYRVSGASMSPTLTHGELLIGYRYGAPRPGHIAVVRRDFPIIKRLIRQSSEGWWIEGDNAVDSTDSRHFGLVSASRIEAVIIWPRR